MDGSDPVQTLVDAFNVVAAEVQNLLDRNTILEHKLRFAHEQYSALASRYAPNASGVASTLAKLQISPAHDSNALFSTSHVPLPRRSNPNSEKVELAVRIREGQKAARQLSGGQRTPRISQHDNLTSYGGVLSTAETVLEQDFTIPGKESDLQCPFQVRRASRGAEDAGDTTRHSADPICAAMYADSQAVPDIESNATAAPKCPIRYLDKHSPEEIAHYVETHKHSLPRSHAICLRRNQQNEEQIRKLDAKYGNLVSMIQDLSQLHAPMLPATEQEATDMGDERVMAGVEGEQRQAPREPMSRRVETWAKAVSLSDGDETEHADTTSEDRTSHFERPLKEVRVGESPSRPWGISVPVYDSHKGLGEEQPAAPLADTSPFASLRQPRAEDDVAKPLKCPFDHTQMSATQQPAGHSVHRPRPLEAQETTARLVVQPQEDDDREFHQETPTPDMPTLDPDEEIGEVETEAQEDQEPPSTPREHPKVDKGQGRTVMVFNGPVIIGYPAEDAARIAELLKHGGRQ